MLLLHLFKYTHNFNRILTPHCVLTKVSCPNFNWFTEFCHFKWTFAVQHGSLWQLLSIYQLASSMQYAVRWALFKALLFKTHSGVETSKRPRVSWGRAAPLCSVCSLKGAAMALCLIVIHTASSATGELMKILGLHGFILLLRIQSGYSVR